MKRSVAIIFSLILLGTTSCGVSSIQNGSGSMLTSSAIENTVKQAEKAEKEFNGRSAKLPSATAAERTTLRDAVLNMDAGKCEAIKETKEYQRCQVVVYTSLASQSKDISYCEKIPLKTSAESCAESVVFQKSISDGNVQLCESLSTDDKKATCTDNYHYNTAQTTKSMKSCDAIARTDLKNTCLDTIALATLSYDKPDMNLCETMMTDAAKTQCGMFMKDLDSAKAAILSEKSENCDKLNDQMVKTYCQSEVHLAKAKKTKDQMYCTTLTDGFVLSATATKNYQTECREAVR